MKTCNYCGVELDVDMNYCPLCGHKSNTPVIQASQVKSTRRVTEQPAAEVFDFDELTQAQKNKLVWEISTIVLVSGVVVSFVINLFVNGAITWSKYPISAGLFLFTLLSLFVFTLKKPILLVSGCFVSTSLLLLSIDLFNHSFSWGVELGIPMVFFSCFVGYILAALVKRSKQKGINIIAYALMAAGILCFFLEGIISRYSLDRFSFRWSIVVLISVVPVSGILAYIHFRLKRVTNLRKFFHI